MNDLDALVKRLRANAQVCRDEQKRPLPPASKVELANNAREWDNAAEAITRLREQCVGVTDEMVDAALVASGFSVTADDREWMRESLEAALADHAKSECPKCVVAEGKERALRELCEGAEVATFERDGTDENPDIRTPALPTPAILAILDRRTDTTPSPSEAQE